MHTQSYAMYWACQPLIIYTYFCKTYPVQQYLTSILPNSLGQTHRLGACRVLSDALASWHHSTLPSTTLTPSSAWVGVLNCTSSLLKQAYAPGVFQVKNLATISKLPATTSLPSKGRIEAGWRPGSKKWNILYLEIKIYD